jgi:1-pyrroline-5-carboxylate dehydrogenase
MSPNFLLNFAKNLTMSNGHFHFPQPKNETVLQFAPGSKEKELLKKALASAKKKKLDIPMYIGSEEVRTGKKFDIRPPHETKHVLGHFHQGEEKHVKEAINAALKAQEKWSQMPWVQRASIFLKAADLLATKYRYDMLAATMLGQSKNPFQAEIDSTCELIDFLRFNVHFLNDIYQQPRRIPSAGRICSRCNAI